MQRRIILDKMYVVDVHTQHQKESTTPVLVDPSELWSHYHDGGCTIRLLCPHKYNCTVQSLLSHLEGEFQCMVGANAYLTPPNASQGFAPHYDDIGAFCLQLEGRKRWKVYPPPPKVQLPRTSSRDFTTQDFQAMDLTPIMDIVLNKGDILSIPRGWIH
jgi:bifunctional lysine-specific demethylase and histidyl-hydroxylase NO66